MSEWKETEFGRIPKDWKFVKASEFCSKITDGTHDSPKRQNEGKPLITSKHIKGRDIDFDNAYYISKDDFDKINERSNVDQWDVIISMIGEYCGFTYIERNINIDYAVKNVGLFKAGNKTKALWLQYFLNSRTGKYILDFNKSGSSQPYISLGALRKLPILLPPLPEQRAIAEVLSSLDDKIDLLHRQNKTLEQMAETLFRQWFPPKERRTDVEDAKENWEEITLYNAIDLIGGGTPKTSIDSYWNGKVKWLSGGDISVNHKSIIINSEKTITEEGLNNSSAKLLPKFSTVISARGTVGKYCILSEPMTFSQSNYGIKPKYKDCFFFTYLLINHSVEELKSAAYGSVFDTITTNTFKGYSIKLPKEEIIRGFENKIKDYFLKILNNQQQIRTLEKLRDTLLPKLMSGEVRVKI